MAQVRETVVNVCTILSCFGMDYVQPESLRLAKYNKPEAVGVSSLKIFTPPHPTVNPPHPTPPYPTLPHPTLPYHTIALP